jgi:hypothetical protein
MTKNGKNFSATLKAMKLDAAQSAETTKNASKIVSAIIKAYGAVAGGINPAQTPPKQVTGLVYGRIQSGKTRAMIASTAMAFDNKFRIAVVMTSNINDLVQQTHLDFSAALPGLMTFTKDTNLDREAKTAKLHMEQGNGCLLLICSKGKSSLHNISDFLISIGGKKYPTIIFDDEGDQASLDTNTRKRSRKSNVAVAPSAINNAIQEELRAAVPKHVYVSVTGTPQAVLLQSAESTHKPSFIIMLPPGESYVGGDVFFASDEPEDSPGLISVVDPNEKAALLNTNGPIPDGLRKSILFFLVAGAAAIKNKGLGERGYSYLCHPSLKNDEQAKAEKRINDFLIEVQTALYPNAGGKGVLTELKSQYDELKKTLKASTPTFNEIKQLILQYLPTRKILVINARAKRQGIAYGRGLNFLIGGNTLGRGIAIRDLLVTYYVRVARVSQIDTMHQHARMYGYRRATLEYTRLFITRQLYYRFRDIYHSDEDLREYIEKYKGNPSTFPIEYQFNLRATRQGVLDVKRTDTLSPGKQIYPNYIVLPQDKGAYDKVLKLLRAELGFTNESESVMDKKSPTTVMINPDCAVAFVKLIKTKSKNTWRDSTIADVIRKVGGKFKKKIKLRFRTADRRIRAQGFLSTGTLSGDEVRNGQAARHPTLWIMSVEATAASDVGAGTKFMYPTLVIPKSLPALFMFNRGS